MIINREYLRIDAQENSIPNNESRFGIFHKHFGFIVSCDPSCGLHEGKKHILLSEREKCAMRKLRARFDYEHNYPFREVEINGNLYTKRQPRVIVNKNGKIWSLTE